MLKFLTHSVSLPVGLYALGLLAAAAIGAGVLRVTIGGGPEPVTKIEYVYRDRPYEVEKIREVYVPRTVTVYQPSPADTVVQYLVPQGLTYAGAIPANAAGMPAVSYTRSEIMVPVASGGSVTEYAYPLVFREPTWGAEIGLAYMAGVYGPTVGASVYRGHLWASAGVLFDVSRREHIGAPELWAKINWRF